VGRLHLRIRVLKFQALFPGIAVILGSLLFATDSVFREKALVALDPRAVGFLEHGIAFIFLIPWVFARRRADFRLLNKKDLGLFLALGLGGSALASTLFTMSVEKIGGASATLFTMLQPVFVLGFAWTFLKERFSSFFVPCAIWVVANMILLSYSQSSGATTGLFTDGEENPEAYAGMFYAFAATVLWGASTVIGKALLARYHNSVVLFWRWASAFVFLGIVVAVKGVSLPWERIFTSEILSPLLYLGIVAQTTAYWVYYVGLRKLPASLATFIELLYPLVGIFLPIVAKGESVTPLQGFASVTLLIAISLLIGGEYPRAVGLRGSVPFRRGPRV
jgi:drug/metabolite transporter (DMT)-like permease